jgi:hypothetical protein
MFPTRLYRCCSVSTRTAHQTAASSNGSRLRVDDRQPRRKDSECPLKVLAQIVFEKVRVEEPSRLP